MQYDFLSSKDDLAKRISYSFSAQSFNYSKPISTVIVLLQSPIQNGLSFAPLFKFSKKYQHSFFSCVTTLNT